MRQRSWNPARLLFVSVLAVLVSAEASRAQTAQVCLSTQLQVSGAVCHGLTRCYRKAMKRHLPLDPACITDQQTKIQSKFLNTESISNCLVEPAADDVFNLVQPEVDDWGNAVHLTGGKCSAKKIGALGRECKQLLHCYSDAAGSSDPVNPACLDSAREKLSSNFIRFDASGICVTTGDYSTLEPQVTGLSDDVFTLVRGVGTTTTTTSTTSTSTTSLTLPPGTCAENGAFDPCIAYRDDPACKACVDGSVDTTPATLCGGAGPLCDDAIKNSACGYAINTGTACAAVCCP